MAKHKKSQRLDPDDVLEGRARPNARELVALIHDVNPSGHDLSAKETARRYAQKSRLQSLLVRRFQDEITVEPGDEPGVIGLRHHASGADACHAVLATLDEDARAWVQLQVDLGGDEAESERSLTPRSEAPPAPAADVPLDQLSTGELLRRGRQVVEDYDYLSAQEHFAAAFERGNAEATLPLLTVLVENLGLDAEALALEDRLDEKALGTPEIRLLLALAAARVYERPRALRLVRADRGDAAAEVFAALARGALERNELDHATGDVSEIQRRGPTHPALLGLGDTVKKRRADERAAPEAEAQRLFDEGRFAEAEARAEALATRWPESAVAQAITRAGRERRRRDEARALAREGSEALAAGEPERALGLLRRALTIGIEGEDAAKAQADVERAEAEEHERAEKDRAGILIQILQQGGPTLRALTDYLTFDERYRMAVLKHCQLIELAYLEQAGFVGAGPDARAAAQAVLALQRAVRCATTDPGTAISIVTENWTYLQQIPDAAKVLSIAEKIVGTRAQLDAERRLQEGLASDGTREGLVRSIKILASVRREDLDDPEFLDMTLGVKRRMLERIDRALEIGKHRSAGRLVEARDALDAMMRFEEAASALDPDDMKVSFDWQKQRDDVVRLLAGLIDLRIWGPPSSEHLLGAEAPELLDVPEAWLPGGQEIVLVESHLGQIFCQTVDLASGRVQRRGKVKMSTPLEIGRIQQRAGRIAVMGRGGSCIEISPETWEIVRGVGSNDPADRLRQGVLAPGARFTWTTQPMDGWWTRVSVDDAEREVTVKDYADPVFQVAIRPLHGLPEPRVIAARDAGKVTVYEARGAPLGPTQEGLFLLPRTAVVHPSGKGLFALARVPGESGPARVRWVELAPDASPRKAPAGADRLLPEIDPDAPCEAVVDIEAQIVFVLATPRSDVAPRTHRLLLAFTWRDEALVFAYEVEVPARVTLAHDPSARGALALSPHEQGVEIVRLSASPPIFHAPVPATPPLDLDALCLAPRRPCAPPGRPLWTLSFEALPAGLLGVEYLYLYEGAERGKYIAAALAQRELIVPRHALLHRVAKPGFAEDFVAAVEARFPGDPEMVQIPAQHAARAGDWARVRDLLAPLDPASLSDAAAQHHDHLLGAALFMTGDLDEARRIVSRGAARPGHCDLSTLLALADDPSPPSPRGAAVRVLAQSLRDADACLAAGDPAGARRALSGLVVREAREVQTLARRARAWLREPDETEPGGAALDGFSRRLALAAFVEAHAEKTPTLRRELPFPGSRWDEPTLDALATEAKAWIDRDKDRPRPGAPPSGGSGTDGSGEPPA